MACDGRYKPLVSNGDGILFSEQISVAGEVFVVIVQMDIFRAFLLLFDDRLRAGL